ncbi:hypothetical protein, partial [Bradyrhizobium sp. 174]|uniref:hypothetical protein n=1 Tax=Bradyrhizobium sp. 174 TaxID=2782645 RepID=UPI001FF8E7B5
MTPMSRSRRNRSDEERCCRDDCKSKLSHVTFLQQISRAKVRLSSLLIFTLPNCCPATIQVRSRRGKFKSRKV